MFFIKFCSRSVTFALVLLSLHALYKLCMFSVQFACVLLMVCMFFIDLYKRLCMCSVKFACSLFVRLLFSLCS